MLGTVDARLSQTGAVTTSTIIIVDAVTFNSLPSFYGCAIFSVKNDINHHYYNKNTDNDHLETIYEYLTEISFANIFYKLHSNQEIMGSFILP